MDYLAGNVQLVIAIFAMIFIISRKLFYNCILEKNIKRAQSTLYRLSSFVTYRDEKLIIVI